MVSLARRLVTIGMFDATACKLMLYNDFGQTPDRKQRNTYKQTQTSGNMAIAKRICKLLPIWLCRYTLWTVGHERKEEIERTGCMS